ncbi:MAG TPA: hypothetical protein VGJ20_46135 [Xanthobacteraceae bacterium]|jgi:hypothetical protein
MKDVPNHNAPRFLHVCWLPAHQAKGQKAGWYVVRICPCHSGEPVTLPFDTEREAWSAREVMLSLREDER